MEELSLQIEALIFASEQSISLLELCEILSAIYERDISVHEVNTCIEAITAKYQNPDQVMALVKINNGYQFLSKPEYHATINQLQAHRTKKKLSQAALETLAIIAYRQPITKLEIEQIRGVNCDYSIQKLLEKELIIITGKAETIGKPILYGTSPLFMDYFGINSTAQLPQLKDIEQVDNEIGQSAE
ncbi:SMC-Scp complex subunit ScpB [Pedobacter sp. BS3]|uniref:SMC-Scp complex subunit ScpB n=1 Tax=Pedobacter sp. BS3 TaxID=2567937 RepID=UPI0011F06F37|nr:SMC-Scp complex subunit ScpB [Pedobacter sp. BS3]TZF84978.1 SMC-Scp complex subunit ScpB [Pedobacter sp. BS3]